MNRKKFALPLIVAAGMLCLLAACAGSSSASSSSAGSPSSAPAASSQAPSSAAPVSSAAVSSAAASSGSAVSASEKLGYQLEKPAAGEEVAVLTTSMGTVKLRLFPQAAPKTVENFKGLIKKGYYNGLTFHRIMKDFMIQGGDPKGDGTGGTSIWNREFADEFNPSLVNIRGAVAMANAGPNTNGSQFFIDQVGPSKFAGWDYYTKAFQMFQQNQEGFVNQYSYAWVDMTKATQAYKDFYMKNGGNPGLDGAYNIIGHGHTVFAQVYEGMDVVDKIAGVKVNAQGKPEQAVKIVKAEIQKYK